MSEPLVSGRLLAGRYEILEALGAGGEARVVKALDQQHGREVALKIRHVRGEQTREEMLGEARLLLGLEPHPALPLVREDFFVEDEYVVAMDWVDGTDLARILAERGLPGLAPSSVVAYLAEAAEALMFLHSREIVHGDVKPANLILTRGGHVKLVDFGLSSTPVMLGRRSGTPGYRAPELAAGSAPSSASDVYALAATAFALLTGSPPAGVLPAWQGIDAALAAQLEAVVRLGLATDPERRPATPGEFVERLRAGWGATLPTGVTTFCLSDIVGSTELWERDPVAMAVALVRHDELIASAVESHGGRFLKSKGEGDATFSVFESATDAVDAAIAAAHALDAEPWPNNWEIAVRFGIHTGEAERRDADYFGPTVNLAARVRGQADRREIMLSQRAADLTSGHLPAGYSLVDLGAHRLKGVEGSQTLHALIGPGVAAPMPATQCPYRGLLAFEPADRAFFFGREDVVGDLIGRMRPGRLLAVVGASGSGKSSVLRAGVVAAVRAGEVEGLDRATIITSGADPRLDVADDPRELVVVDQFEELYTLCADRDQRDDFIEALLALTSPVVIAVRADLYGQLSGHPALARAAADDHVLLGAMSDAELQRAVTEPAQLAGLRLEAGLVDLILRDVAREPGALPLLSHALRVTWEHRDGRTMTVAGYRESGGVASAIAQTADAVVASVPAERHALMRGLFVRLTELGEGSEDSRRRVRIEELVPEGGSRAEVEALLDRLAEARLLTLGEGTAEVAHEVLIREWPTLRQWLEEDRAGIRLHRDLGNAARRWDASGREAGDLYRGTRLAAAAEWAEQHPQAINAAERAFLDASLSDSQDESDRQRRANRRLRALLAGAGVLLALAVVAGVVALSQRTSARDAATREAAQRLGAEAVTLDRIDGALRLASAGFGLDDSPATRSNLLRVLLRNPAATGVLNGDGDKLIEIASSSDGTTVAVADDFGTVTVFDGATRARLGAYETNLRVNAMQFAPGGDRLMVAGSDLRAKRHSGRLEIIAARSRRSLRSMPLRHPGGSEADRGVGATFAPDGRSIVVGWFPAGPEERAWFLRRFDATSGAPLGRPRPVAERGPLTFLLGTRDGLLLAVGDGEIEAIDGETLRVVRRYRPGAFNAAVSPDGKTLAASSVGGTVRLLDLESGRVHTLPERHRRPVLSVVFSPDGRTLATGADDGEVIVWDLQRRRQVETLRGHTGDVIDQTFSPDGRTLYSASGDGTAIAWDVSGTRRLGAWFPTGFVAADPDKYPPAFSVSPDGRALAVARLDGKLDLIDAQTLRTRTTVRAFDRRTVATAIAYSPDGTRLAVAGGRGVIGLFDAGSGARLGALLHAPAGPCADPASMGESGPCFEQTIQALDFTKSGLLAAASIGGTVRIWDVARRRPIGRAARLPRYVVALAVSPDGSKMAVPFGFVNAAAGVEILDVRTGKRVARLATSTQPRSVAFSPDGRLLASGETNGTAVVWETDRWRQTGRPLIHDGYVLDIRFSPNGRTLATSSTVGTIALWDVRSRKQIGSPLPRVPDRRFVPRDERWVTVRFTPDGKRLFAVYENGRGARWELDPAAWVRHACAVAGGGLTRSEWEDAVPQQDYRRTCP